VQRRHPHGRHLAVPHERHVGRLLVRHRDERGADRVDDGLDGSQQRVARLALDERLDRELDALHVDAS
jgi:hypothetical protein